MGQPIRLAACFADRIVALLRSLAVAGCVPTPCRGLAQGRRGKAVPCGRLRQGVTAGCRWPGEDRNFDARARASLVEV